MRMTRRRLPHLEVKDATYFITFHRRADVDTDLTAPIIAPLVVGALRFFDGERYLLYDYTVMPNHVHVILKPLPEHPKGELSAILQSLKGWTSHAINELIGRRGAFWQEESHERVINGWTEYRATARYIWYNPRAWGLVGAPEDWPWTGRGKGE